MLRTSREGRLKLTSPWPTPATMATTLTPSSSLATHNLWSRGPGNPLAPSPPRGTTQHTLRYGGEMVRLEPLRVWLIETESQ